MTQCFVYVHCKPDLTPFYVGKGSIARAHSLRPRNAYHGSTVAKYGPGNIVVMCHICESETEAYFREVLVIKSLRDSGTRLTNMTDGGEGASGESLRLSHAGTLARGIGIHAPGIQSKAGKIGGAKAAEVNRLNNTGLFGRTFQEQSEAGKIGGKRSIEVHRALGLGLFGMTKAQRGAAGAKGIAVTNSRRFKCHTCGMVSTKGPLSRHQKMLRHSGLTEQLPQPITLCENTYEN